eukprot:NODE_677_length_4824_cov_0.791323.p5 type:complete len:136 gc:universal NODE_677_length_4824_cov_0.791323:1376-1783(+)
MYISFVSDERSLSFEIFHTFGAMERIMVNELLDIHDIQWRWHCINSDDIDLGLNYTNQSIAKRLEMVNSTWDILGLRRDAMRCVLSFMAVKRIHGTSRHITLCSKRRSPFGIKHVCIFSCHLRISLSIPIGKNIS